MQPAPVRAVMVQFEFAEHDHNREKFLAFARNDKQNNGAVVSNEVRDLSPNRTTTSRAGRV